MKDLQKTNLFDENFHSCIDFINQQEEISENSKLSFTTDYLSQYLNLFSYEKNFISEKLKNIVLIQFNKNTFLYNVNFEYIQLLELKNNNNISSLYKHTYHLDELKNLCKIKNKTISFNNEKILFETDIMKINNSNYTDYSEYFLNYLLNMNNFSENHLKINKNQLIEVLENGLKFCSKDKINKELNCINFEFMDNILQVKGINRYSGIISKINTTTTCNNFNILIQNNYIKQLLKVLKNKLYKDIENIEIYLSNDALSTMFKFENNILIIKNLESSYPKINKIFDEAQKQCKNTVCFNRHELIEKLSILKKLDNDKIKVVKFEIMQEKTVLKNDYAKLIIDNIDAVTFNNNEVFDICFNIEFLLNGLNSFKNTEIIQLNLNQKLNPCLIEHNDVTCLIMPFAN